MNPTCGIATLAIVSSVLCGCDGMTEISGIVMDINAKPISGAQVSVVPSEAIAGKYSPPPAKTTDASGAYEIGFSHRPVAAEVKLIVTHENYQTVEETLKTGRQPNHDIRMKSAHKAKTPEDDVPPALDPILKTRPPAVPTDARGN